MSLGRCSVLGRILGLIYSFLFLCLPALSCLDLDISGLGFTGTGPLTWLQDPALKATLKIAFKTHKPSPSRVAAWASRPRLPLVWSLSRVCGSWVLRSLFSGFQDTVKARPRRKSYLKQRRFHQDDHTCSAQERRAGGGRGASGFPFVPLRLSFRYVI